MLGYETSKPKLSEMHRIVPKYAAKWKELGELLKIPGYTLEEIASDNKHEENFKGQCCKGVLEKWLEITEEPTWSTIHKAIDELPYYSSSKCKEN